VRLGGGEEEKKKVRAKKKTRVRVEGLHEIK